MALGGPGPRHGANVPQRGRPQVWMCPSCRTQNTSIIEEGCAACGAGTKEANDRAMREVQATHRVVDPIELAAHVVEGITEDITDDELLRLTTLTEPARTTILRALTALLDTPAESDELPRAVIRAWCLRLADQ